MKLKTRHWNGQKRDRASPRVRGSHQHPSPLIPDNRPLSPTLLGYYHRQCSFFRALYPTLTTSEIREKAFAEACREWGCRLDASKTAAGLDPNEA